MLGVFELMETLNLKKEYTLQFNRENEESEGTNVPSFFMTLTQR